MTSMRRRIIAFGWASLCLASGTLAGQAGRDSIPRAASLPLLVESDLPRELQLSARDSIAVNLTILNRGTVPVLLRYGSCSQIIRAQRIESTDSLKARIARGEQIVDPPGAWGTVQNLQSPSPSTECTMELRGSTLAPRESITFARKSGPLPTGEFRLTACFIFYEFPREPQGGLQGIQWCAADGSHVRVSR